MSKLFIKLGLLLCCVTSCKTVSVHQEFQKTTETQQVLGSIGETNGTIVHSKFSSTVSPAYDQAIKVTATSIPFTKSTYKAFAKAKQYQPAAVAVNYVDSLEIKPSFVQLQLADKVALVTALNAKENAGVKEYLSNQKYAALVTNVSIALNKEEQEILTKATTVHLVQNKLGNYLLQCYQDNKQKTIQFNQGVVFAYKAANSCWKENSKHQLEIVDLVSQGKDCPKKTYKSAHNAKKRIDYFKL